jgi:hypothetical protein
MVMHEDGCGCSILFHVIAIYIEVYGAFHLWILSSLTLAKVNLKSKCESGRGFAYPMI